MYICIYIYIYKYVCTYVLYLLTRDTPATLRWGIGLCQVRAQGAVPARVTLGGRGAHTLAGTVIPWAAGCAGILVHLG